MRRPKGKVQIRLGAKWDTGDMFKDRAAWLLESLNAYYSHCSGYCLSPARADILIRLYQSGFDPSRKYFGKNKEAYTYSRGELEGLTLKQALALCQPVTPNEPQPETPR